MDKWAAYHQAQPAENVDWAQLAQQWMAMKEHEDKPAQNNYGSNDFAQNDQLAWHKPSNPHQAQSGWGDWTSSSDTWNAPPRPMYPPPPHHNMPPHLAPPPPSNNRNYGNNGLPPAQQPPANWRSGPPAQPVQQQQQAPRPMFPSGANAVPIHHQNDGYGGPPAPGPPPPRMPHRPMFAAHANDYPPVPPPQWAPVPPPPMSQTGHFFNNDVPPSASLSNHRLPSLMSTQIEPPPMMYNQNKGKEGQRSLKRQSEEDEEDNRYETHGYMAQQNYPMDAAARKKLPAWILEGLDRAEREKQKQIEKEEKLKRAEEEKARRRAETGKSKFDSSSDEEDQKDDEKERKSWQVDDIKPNDSEDSEDDIEEKREAFMKCVKVLMMNVLLEASNDGIMRLVHEGIEEYEKEKKERLANAAPQLVAKSSALAALAAFGDGDESDEDEEDQQNQKQHQQSEIQKDRNGNGDNKADDFKAPVGIPSRKIMCKTSNSKGMYVSSVPSCALFIFQRFQIFRFFVLFTRKKSDFSEEDEGDAEKSERLEKEIVEKESSSSSSSRSEKKKKRSRSRSKDRKRSRSREGDRERRRRSSSEKKRKRSKSRERRRDDRGGSERKRSRSRERRRR